MRNPKVPVGTLRQLTLANAMENQLELRVGALFIHLMHIPPGLRRGIVLRIGTPETVPHLSLAARTMLTFGSA